MSERFFVDEPITSGEATLGGQEAHHLLHVLRGKPGQEIILIDGMGREYLARIVDCGRREARLQVVSSQVVSREPRVEVALGVALPKGERQRWLVEKAVELGVASLVPLVSDFSVSQPTPAALARLRRAAIEATKQCGRTRLMAIGEPLACREYFEATTAPGSRSICAHPGGEGRISPAAVAPLSVRLAVGPEGGFSEEEIHAAREAGWTIASLGSRILRVETAAVAMAALFTLDTTGDAPPFDRERDTR